MNKKRQVIKALAGILCLVVGASITLLGERRYAERRYIVDAAACRMNMLVLNRAGEQPRADTPTVVMLHGLSANQIIMEYLARSFAELGLRVYVPDLPGHGRSPGPFTPAEAEACSASLVRGLAARGMLLPERTLLVGHSMGGAIALRIAEKFRPAGVIAISPAPMQAAHGVSPENLLYPNVPHLPPNTLILAGQYEPKGLVANAAELAATSGDPSVNFTLVPLNSHVSMLFSPTVARDGQQWAARVLSVPDTAVLPSHANLLGFLLGIAGLLLLGGPFLREMVGNEPRTDPGAAREIPWLRGALEVALFSIVALHVLRFWLPLRFLHLFEGDYLASFFLIVGLGLLLAHLPLVRMQFPVSWRLLLGTAFAALLLHFLVTGWFELTATGAWLTLQRWARFPAFFLASFLFLFGMELTAGPVVNGRRRFAYWFLLIALSWSALALGVFYLKSGEILVVLLCPYFGLQFLLTGLGIQLVRRQSGSAAMAAVFGAILLAGFCLVLFPVS